MPRVTASELARIAGALFVAYGVPQDQAMIVGDALAQANLAGHDSHGVIRVPEYVRYLESRVLQPNAEIKIVKDNPPLLLVSGNHGFGQVIGRWAMDLAIARAKRTGLLLMGLNHSGHLGRIGDYPAMAVKEGFVSLHFVNTHGGGKLVAPYGGAERRMSANPIAAGIPVQGRTPVIIDISTSAIAGGKVHVAHNRREKLPEAYVLDENGEPTTDPSSFVLGAGALLPFGGHKGYALGLLCDVLAGALCDASCSSPETNRVANAMLSILIDPTVFRDGDGFQLEVSRYLDYLKSSALRPGFSEILYPGEPEIRTAEKRAKEGIEIDDRTWGEITILTAKHGLSVEALSEKPYH